jgi:hypothetical protein
MLLSLASPLARLSRKKPRITVVPAGMAAAARPLRCTVFTTSETVPNWIRGTQA